MEMMIVLVMIVHVEPQSYLILEDRPRILQQHRVYHSTPETLMILFPRKSTVCARINKQETEIRSYTHTLYDPPSTANPLRTIPPSLPSKYSLSSHLPSSPSTIHNAAHGSLPLFPPPLPLTPPQRLHNPSLHAPPRTRRPHPLQRLHSGTAPPTLVSLNSPPAPNAPVISVCNSCRRYFGAPDAAAEHCTHGPAHREHAAHMRGEGGKIGMQNWIGGKQRGVVVAPPGAGREYH